MTGETYQN